VSDFLAPGSYKFKLTVDGRERSYLVYRPAAASGVLDSAAVAPQPLVLAFHGAGTNARTMARFCGLNRKADAEGFTVVYPQGSGRMHWFLSFNGGNCCGYAMDQQINDVAYTAAVLDDVSRRTPVDDQRVYATGMSNGAVMTYLLASTMAHRIAAIAPVAGPMGTAACQPCRPVPVCHFHGTADDFARYEGGVGGRSISQTDFYSVQHTIATWVAANNASQRPIVEPLLRIADDSTSVVRTTHPAKPGGAPVVLYTINGGGHTWPGELSILPELGVTTQNLCANDVMWEFFKQHPLPAAT